MEYKKCKDCKHFHNYTYQGGIMYPVECGLCDCKKFVKNGDGEKHE